MKNTSVMSTLYLNKLQCTYYSDPRYYLKVASTLSENKTSGILVSCLPAHQSVHYFVYMDLQAERGYGECQAVSWLI